MKTNKEDIEIMLFDYAEGNLSPEERKEVEAFLKENPQYAKMLDSYQESPILEKPLEVKFENKNELYSLAKGKKTRKIVFKPSFIYWSSAVAAIVLLFFFTRPLLTSEQKATITNDSLIAKTETKKEENKTKKEFTETKKEFTETKKNFVFVIEEENDTIIHQIAFQEIELPSAEIEKQERILYMRYEESIMVKKVSKPSLASRIVKSIGLEEKIEEFYNSDFVSNTRNTINTARSLGKKQVKTTTTTIKREESINV
ncbi:MAG: hypothetical protein J6U84_03395 [Bacteroidales bacterium]|nr:hypothetical protein [Bacteroidales bacterium]